MIEVDSVARERISVTSSINAAPAELLSLGVCQVPTVALVEHTVRKCTARADREEVTLQARSVGIDVKDSRAL